MMLEAVKVTLDPTPRQERLLESHAGAARFAYNKGLAHVRDVLERGDAPEWSYYALRKWWNQAKDALAVDEATGEPWWPENSKEAYNSGLESLADALKNFSESRKGRRKAAGWGSRASSPRTPAFGASRIRPARSAPSTMTHTR
ncbi:helix-turn-helix domain-containing protein [Bifidobacterium longum]|nr:helix-turn-helix domain-containing protein [Bifidobacterium longum]UHC29414.1 helix-turn-helix domain-containing protein [Bifidobacterium longum]